MARWRRVDTPRSFFEVTITMVILVGVFEVTLVAPAIGQPLISPPVLGVVLVSLLLLTAIRAIWMGVFFGDLGVRSCSFWRTTIVPWASIEKFEDRRAASNPWALGSDLPARAVWIVRWDGETIQTPLVYWERRFISDGSLSRPNRNHWIWSEAECSTAQSQLTKALARARHNLARDADED